MRTREVEADFEGHPLAHLHAQESKSWMLLDEVGGVDEGTLEPSTVDWSAPYTEECIDLESNLLDRVLVGVGNALQDAVSKAFIEVKPLSPLPVLEEQIVEGRWVLFDAEVIDPVGETQQRAKTAALIGRIIDPSDPLGNEDNVRPDVEVG